MLCGCTYIVNYKGGSNSWRKLLRERLEAQLYRRRKRKIPRKVVQKKTHFMIYCKKKKKIKEKNYIQIVKSKMELLQDHFCCSILE